MHKIFNWMSLYLTMDYSHSLRVGGLRYVLLRVNSQVCLTRLIFNFHIFFSMDNESNYKAFKMPFP